MRFVFSSVLSLFFLFGIAVMNVHSQSNALILKKTDGTDQSIAFAKLKKITFSGTNLLLNFQSDPNESVSLLTIRKMVFGTYTSVNSITADSKDLVVYPNPSTDFICIKNRTVDKSKVVIYSISGAQVLCVNSYSGDDKIDIRSLRRGMYILKLDNQVFKFTKL
jgi:hypothetical protein